MKVGHCAGCAVADKVSAREWDQAHSLLALDEQATGLRVEVDLDVHRIAHEGERNHGAALVQPRPFFGAQVSQVTPN